MRVSGFDYVTLLYASEQRRRVLFCLANTSSRPGELAERAATSRKTVHQALSKFVDHGWVTIDSECGSEQKRTGHQRTQYTLTASGQLLIRVLQSEKEPESGLDDDVVTYLAASKHRPQLLNLLREQPQGIPDIAASEDVARAESWLYQTINEFADRDWVHQPEGDGTYALTACGCKTLDRFETLAGSIGWIAEHNSALNQLGEIGGTVPARALARNRTQTTVVEADAGDPDAVLNYYSKQLTEREPANLWGITPVVSSLSNRIHCPLVENNRTRIELVTDDAVVDAARSSYSHMLEAATMTEDFDIYVYPERLRFGLAILKESRQALLSGHDRIGAPRVCIDSTTESFVEWATTLFDTYRENAVPLKNC